MAEEKELIVNHKTGSFDGMTKQQIISEIAKVTGLKQAVVRDVMNAFTDIATRELVLNGVFNWPSFVSVTLVEMNEVKRYQKDLDKTLIYPKQTQLRARVSTVIKKIRKEALRAEYNKKNGVSREDWWVPYFYCDGDWREKEKKESKLS